jgi:hypothetical protein
VRAVAESMRRYGNAHDGTVIMLRDCELNPSSNGRALARYAHIVARDSLARQLTAVCSEGRTVLQDPATDPGEYLDSLKARLADVDSAIGVRGLGAVGIEDFLAKTPEMMAPWVIPGLLRSDWRVVTVADEGVGKALASSTRIPTPDGWTTMGELQPGDFVFDETGEQCKVEAATEVMRDRPCYLVCFSDGAQVIADAKHSWIVVAYEGRQHGHWDYTRVTTEEMARSISARAGFSKNYAVDVAGVLECGERDLPIDPYVLGAWLGDGTTSSAGFTCADEEIVDEIRSAGYTVRRVPVAPYGWWICADGRISEATEKAKVLVGQGFSARNAALATGIGPQRLRGLSANAGRKRPYTGGAVPRIQTFIEELRELGVLGDKHIPVPYLRAAPWQRLALLAGLMDTDGTVGVSGGRGRGSGAAHCEFTSTNHRLALDVLELVLSLGIKATIAEGNASLNGRVTGKKWRVTFQTSRPVFRLKRKLARIIPLRTHRATVRYVESVNPIPSVPVRCVQVSSESGCFLAGDAMIPTHNSVLLTQLAVMASWGLHPFTPSDGPIPPMRVLIMDLENPEQEVHERMKRVSDSCRLLNPWRLDKQQCWLIRRPGGIDLRKRAHRLAFEADLRNYRPQMVALGPVYKCYSRTARENDEQVANEVQHVLDDLRTRYEFGLILEHHAPKAERGGKRDLVPFGSSLWLRWSELGLSLSRVDNKFPALVLKVGNYRGQRVANSWPDELRRGTNWPWEGKWDDGVPAESGESF